MRTPSVFRKLVLTAALAAAPAASFGAVFISVGIAPPPLPVYAQPICPGDGYIWTPGYWAWSDEEQGYYWVPGVWVQPPTVGVLWTPGYWGWESGAYLWHAGYWGPHIGFYGGVNYGFGYTGFGYEGGYWNHGVFAYNRAVNNINVTNIHNVYNKTVIVNNNTTINRVSYNGGNGGLQARPTSQEQVAMREQHFQPTGNQMQHQQLAGQNRQQFASLNHGQPPMAAQARVGDRSNFVPSQGVAQRPNNFAGNGQPRPNQTAVTNTQHPSGPAQNGAMQQRGFTGPANAPNQARPNGYGQPAPQQRGYTGQPSAGYQQRPETVQRGFAGQPNPGARQAQPQLQTRPGGYQPQTRPQQVQQQGQPRQPVAQSRPASQPHSEPRGGEGREHR